uniref:Cathepsin propeptide inhibitor domain-containing protein n=1 Tax=Acrobeloides nanus TaxID=290746 RepID=A0A914CJ18_9BILA
MMTQALVFLSLVGLSYQAGLGDTLESLPGNLGSLVDFTQAFNNFKQKHGRVYKNSAEHQLRFAAFKQNLQDVLQLQKEGGRGTAAFGVTKFADWTKEEKAQVKLIPSFLSRD